MQTVRRRITEILKANGSATVAELAAQLDMAQVSVRHHLDILVGQDLVEPAGVRRREGAGRPSQVYALTPSALKLFPQRHEILARDMLAEMKALLSPDEMHGVLIRMAEKTSRKAPAPSAGQSLEERLDAVTGFLTEEGYNAHWELRNGRYEIHACNCPHSGVVDHHPELCTMDQLMMQLLIPHAVRLQSRVADGVGRCIYVVDVSRASPEPMSNA